ncbi:MAG: aminotransferase class V-fold PLP-dependent enzyme [Bdellovibrionota bacterium]
MKQEVYLDANASHPLLDRVKAELTRSFEAETLGNASSVHHAAGRRSRKLLSNLKDELQRATGLDSAGWIFTSGATESLNMALTTALCEGWRVWCTDVEHSAVLKFCAKRIPEATRLPVLASGEIDLAHLGQKIMELEKGVDVLLVLQSHNNETGFPLLRAVDIGAFARLVKSRPEIRILWDAVQSVGKTDPKILRDMLAIGNYCVVTGHKLGALSGLGAIWRDKASPLKPLLLGGTQEQGMRAGTEALWSAVAWLEALREWQENGVFHRENWTRLKDALVSTLAELPRVKLLRGSEKGECLANTLPLVVQGMTSDLMLQKLDLEGVCVSSGSACQSGVAAVSHVLMALGCSEEESKSFIRVSMPVRCQTKDLDFFVAALRKILA